MASSNPLAKLLHFALAEANTVIANTALAGSPFAHGIPDTSAGRNKYVSDVCSSREGMACANGMSLTGLSYTSARAKVSVNDKKAHSSPVWDHSVKLIKFVAAWRELTGQVSVFDAAHEAQQQEAIAPAKLTKAAKAPKAPKRNTSVQVDTAAATVATNGTH